MANSYFFPTLFAATAMGACNFLARVSSAFSYIVSEMDEPTPMYIFTSLCALSAVCSFFLVENEKDNDTKTEKEGDKVKKKYSGVEHQSD